MSKKRIRISKKDDGLDPRLKAYIQQEVDKRIEPYKDKFTHSHTVMMEVAKFLHGMIVIFEDLDQAAQFLVTNRGTVSERISEYGDNIILAYENINVLLHTVAPLAKLYESEDEELAQILEEVNNKIRDRREAPFSDSESAELFWDDIVERRDVDGT